MPEVLASVPYLLGGLRTTLVLAAAAILLSLPLGVAAGGLRLSRWPWLRWPAIAYIEVVRGTPLLLVIFWFYFLFPILVGRPVGSAASALAALVVFTGAYVAEIVRAGVNAVPKGQWEASLSTGLSPLQGFVLVILPQALSKMIPALVSQFIALFKDTSLAYVIGVIELTRAAIIVNNRIFKPFEIFGLIAVLYFVCTFILASLARRLERGQQPARVE